MTVYINATNGAGSVEALTATGYDSTRTSRNIVHDLIGGGIAVTLLSPRPRSGRLELLMGSEQAAWDALALHEFETSFSLVDEDRPAIGMTYVLNGDVSIALDDATRDHWLVTVGYQEVGA